jgi:hypothetical protein
MRPHKMQACLRFCLEPKTFRLRRMFNYALSVDGMLCRMTAEMLRIWMEDVLAQSPYYPSIRLERMRKAAENLSVGALA